MSKKRIFEVLTALLSKRNDDVYITGEEREKLVELKYIDFESFKEKKTELSDMIPGKELIVDGIEMEYFITKKGEKFVQKYKS